MRTIHKYQLRDIGVNVVAMPPDSVILTAQMQNNIPTLWALVDTDAKPWEQRTFFVIGTGMEMPPGSGDYIGTVQEYNGLVWHVFEITE